MLDLGHIQPFKMPISYCFVCVRLTKLVNVCFYLLFTSFMSFSLYCNTLSRCKRKTKERLHLLFFILSFLLFFMTHLCKGITYKLSLDFFMYYFHFFLPISSFVFVLTHNFLRGFPNHTHLQFPWDCGILWKSLLGNNFHLNFIVYLGVGVCGCLFVSQESFYSFFVVVIHDLLHVCGVFSYISFIIIIIIIIKLYLSIPL